MIKFRGVTKRFPGATAPALIDLDLTVRNGTVLGLVGRNGAGKSTLLRLAAGITRPTAGRIEVGGRDLAVDKVDISRYVGWVPETPRFEADERPLALLEHLGRLDGRRGPDARRRAGVRLARLGLTELSDRPIRTLSQGQTKRLALAAAWLEDPSHLLYDEVTNGLDAPGRALLAGSLEELRARGGLAILASHRLEEVEAWCDEIVVLQDGRRIATVRGRAAPAGAARRFHLVLDRPTPELLDRLRRWGTVADEGAGVSVSGEAPASRDLVGELVAEGYRIREVRTIRADLADHLEQEAP